ncbi:MAG: class III signal peptide-containing protein [Candidatus Diapherotrites archaeon]|uniref:Class III signal peptide-containing protein n=1 Tax=Candidatus Iainarchaeum sp. TaxID=3101447 RepID=A0A938YXI7_9ARCH|nr:class III signal peptide-containing protein [Candidatus Diapherotrites archaeon]
MDGKGQGALEYLLLIGGAVLVAAIVIALITGTTGGQPDPRAMAKCAPLTDCSKCLTTGGISAENQCAAVIEDASGKEYKIVHTGACTDMNTVDSFKYCSTMKTI